MNIDSISPFLSSDSTVNTLMYNWNIVMLLYCCGGSFTGNNFTPTIYNNKRLYFRGFQNLIGIKDHLNSLGLQNASSIVIGGCSAGSMALYIHLGWWRSVISKSIPTIGVPQDGFFMKRNDVDGFIDFKDNTERLFIMMNSTTNEECTRIELASGGNQSSCMFPEVVIKYINNIPLYIINAKYNYNDIFQTTKNINSFGSDFMNIIYQTIKSNKFIGVFIDSCLHHCLKNVIYINTTNSSYGFHQFYNYMVDKNNTLLNNSYNPYTIQDKSYPCWNCGCNSINYYILIYTVTVIGMIIIFLLILIYAFFLFRSKQANDVNTSILKNKVQYSQ